MTVEFTDENFQEQVLDSPVPVMVDFWSEGCGPCKRLSPIIDELAAEKDDVVVGKVNVSENMDLAMKYAISGVPTVLVFKGGEVVGRKVGAAPKEQLEEMLN